jgi:hypothetical protein
MYTLHRSKRQNSNYTDEVRSYLVPALDVCPPVQKNLDGPQVAFLSSIVDGSESTLLERTIWNFKHII